MATWNGEVSAGAVALERWTRAERLRLSAIVGVIAGLHVVGWTMYFYYTHHLGAATSFAGAGTLAYALGVRHAFDADHIAAIDDSTRLMLARGRRPVGVGFFFAMGHSSVVLALAFIVVTAADAATSAKMAAFRAYGGVAAAVTATVMVNRRLSPGASGPGWLAVTTLPTGRNDQPAPLLEA